MTDAPSATPRRNRNRWMLGMLALVALAATSAATREAATRDPSKADATQPDVYALLYLDRFQPWIAFPSVSGPPCMDKEAWKDYRATQAALLKSRLVLTAALRNPKVAALTILRGLPDPVDWLEDNLQTDFPRASTIMRIGLSGKDPAEMCTLVDAVTTAYLDEIVEKDNNRRRKRYEQLREIAQGFENKIKDIRKSLRQLEEEVGPGDKHVLAIRQDTARAEYDQAKSELARLRAEVRTLKLQVEMADKGLAPEAVVPPAKAPDGATKDGRPGQVQAKQRLEYLQKLEKLLDADVLRLGKEAKGFVGKTLDLIEFQREVEEKEELLRTIQKQAGALEVELDAPPRIRRLQEAVIKRKKTGR